MKSIKNIVIGVLAAAFTMAPMSALTSYASILPEEVAGTRFEEPVQILSALDIMVGDDDGKFRLDDNIKRSEVAKMAIHALGLEDIADSNKGESRFPDVSVNHWANGYINLATAQGLIEGDDRGNFRPNDSITYAEAMAIFVRALGYEPMAEDKGDYPNGHVVVAGSIGLTKSVHGSTNKPITRGNVAFLTNNALTVGLMEKVGYGNNASYEITDKTLLKDKLDVTKHTGQISAIPYTSLEGDSNLNDNEIKIGDTVYETAYNMNNLFGYNVTYYLRSNDDGDVVILAMPQKDQNQTITIKAELFEGITQKAEKKAVEYYEKEDAAKTNVAALEDTAKLIYNGKAEALTDENLDITGKSGEMTLLDTDRNGIYDIVFVTDYYNIVVEEVTSTGKIVDKYGAPTIKLGDDEDVSYRILRGLQEIEVKELKEYDVLSVAKSKDGELIDIRVSNETVSGKVTGKDSKGVYIQGKHYKIASNYPEEITMGTEGKFYLDIEGKIAAINDKVVVSDNYGYLIKAYASDETEKATFRIFTKEGKDVTFTANEKIRYNGATGQKAVDVVDNFIEDGKTVKQLVTYTTNSAGNLTAIYTAEDNTETGAAKDGKFTLDYKLEEAVFNEKTNSLGSVRLTEETHIFDIQEDVDDYSIADIKMFEDKQKYNVMVFDITEEFTAKAIIVTNAEFQTNSEAPIAIVDKVIAEVNDDDEETDRLYAFVNGEKVEVLAEDTGILVKGEGAALENGDIIQYKTNDKDEIVSIRVLFDVDTKGTEKNETPVEDLEILYGKVTKKFANSINVTVNGGSVRNVVLPSGVVVYTVDTTKTKNQIAVGTTGDIQAYDEDEGNRVFIRIQDEVVKEVVVIK